MFCRNFYRIVEFFHQQEGDAGGSCAVGQAVSKYAINTGDGIDRIYPAHVVNAWMGHTEAVAMAYYRQTTGKAIEKFFEQAAGQVKKKVQEFAHVPAGKVRNGVETEKNTCANSCTFPPVFQGQATNCTAIQGLPGNPHYARRDSNP